MDPSRRVLNMVDIEMDIDQEKPCFLRVSQTADSPHPKEILWNVVKIWVAEAFRSMQID